MTEQGRLVFVSHSGRWSAEAMAVVSRLESSGIACWIAQRDIPAADRWERRLVRAIRDAAAMVVLLNDDFQQSDHCEREVRIAAENKIPFAVFRTDDGSLEDQFEYYLGGVQWVDFDDMTDDVLVDTIERVALPPLQRFGLHDVSGREAIDDALEEAEHARQQGAEALTSRLFDDLVTVTETHGTRDVRCQAVVGRAFADLQLGNPIDDATRSMLDAIAETDEIALLSAGEQMKLRARLRLLAH